MPLYHRILSLAYTQAVYRLIDKFSEVPFYLFSSYIILNLSLIMI